MARDQTEYIVTALSSVVDVCIKPSIATAEVVNMCTRTVFVGDLSYFCRESHLLQLFSSVGHVIDIDLKRNQEGESQLHAFVKFENEMSVPIAIEVYHGVKYMGRRMVVNGTGTRAQKKDYNNWYKLTIHFSATSDATAVNENSNVEINEEFLDMLCSPYGILGDVIIRSHARTVLPTSTQMNPASMSNATLRQVNRNSPSYFGLNDPNLDVSETFNMTNNNNSPMVTVVSGYGVVFFLELTGANRALQSLHNTTVNHNILLTCNLSPRPNDLLLNNNNSSNNNINVNHNAYLHNLHHSGTLPMTNTNVHVAHIPPNNMYHSSSMNPTTQIPRHLLAAANTNNTSSPRSTFVSSHSPTKPLYNNNNSVTIVSNNTSNVRKSPASSPPQSFYPAHSNNNMTNNVVHPSIHSSNTHNMSPYQLQLLLQLEQQQQILQQQKQQLLLMKRSDSDLSRFTLNSNTNHSNSISNNTSHNNSFAHLLAVSDDFSNNSKSSSFYNSSSSLSHNSSFIGSNNLNNNHNTNAGNNANNNVFNIPAINTSNTNNANGHHKFPTLHPTATTQTPKSYNTNNNTNATVVGNNPASNTPLYHHYLSQPNPKMHQPLGMSGSFYGEAASEYGTKMYSDGTNMAAHNQYVPSSSVHHQNHSFMNHHANNHGTHSNNYPPSVDIVQSLLASNSFSAEDTATAPTVMNHTHHAMTNTSNHNTVHNLNINDGQFEVDSLIN